MSHPFDRELAFYAADLGLTPIAKAGDFDEEKHPRDDHGRFGSGGGGGGKKDGERVEVERLSSPRRHDMRAERHREEASEHSEKAKQAGARGDSEKQAEHEATSKFKTQQAEAHTEAAAAWRKSNKDWEEGAAARAEARKDPAVSDAKHLITDQGSPEGHAAAAKDLRAQADAHRDPKEAAHLRSVADEHDKAAKVRGEGKGAKPASDKADRKAASKEADKHFQEARDHREREKIARYAGDKRKAADHAAQAKGAEAKGNAALQRSLGNTPRSERAAPKAGRPSVGEKASRAEELKSRQKAEKLVNDADAHDRRAIAARASGNSKEADKHFQRGDAARAEAKQALRQHKKTFGN